MGTEAPNTQWRTLGVGRPLRRLPMYCGASLMSPVNPKTSKFWARRMLLGEHASMTRRPRLVQRRGIIGHAARLAAVIERLNVGSHRRLKISERHPKFSALASRRECYLYMPEIPFKALLVHDDDSCVLGGVALERATISTLRVDHLEMCDRRRRPKPSSKNAKLILW
jgi:hypothetical protein